MQNLRKSVLAFGAVLMIGAIALGRPYSRGNSLRYQDTESTGYENVYLEEDSVAVLEEYPDTLPSYDMDWYDPVVEFNKIKDNAYLADKEAALDFRKAYSAYCKGSYDEAWFRYKGLADLGYPYARCMGRALDDYIEKREAYNLYISSGTGEMTPEQIYKVARGMVEAGEEETAIALYEEAFRRGYAPAASNLSLIYYLGRNDGFMNPANREKALEWAHKGVEAGDSISSYHIGVFYDEGMVLPHDDKKAVEYYERAVAKNVPQALNNLSSFYLLGREVEQDIEKGLELKRRAARAGHGNCATVMAVNSLLTADYAKSLEYARMAAEAGNVDIYNMLIGYALGDNVEAGLSKNPDIVRYIKELYSEGLVSDLLNDNIMGNLPDILDLLETDWKEIAAKAGEGDPFAMKQMVWDALYGLHSPKDYSEAMRRLEKLTALDESYRLALAHAYLNINGKTRDYLKAKENMEKFIADHNAIAGKAEKGMETGDDDAVKRFMDFKAFGVTVDQPVIIYPSKDYSSDDLFELPYQLSSAPERIEFYISLLNRKDEILGKAAQGDPDGLFDLYQLIDIGLYRHDYAPGVTSSPTHYLFEAARGGNENACEELARYFYFNGNPVASDYWINRMNNNNPK